MTQIQIPLFLSPLFFPHFTVLCHLPRMKYPDISLHLQNSHHSLRLSPRFSQMGGLPSTNCSVKSSHSPHPKIQDPRTVLCRQPLCHRHTSPLCVIYTPCWFLLTSRQKQPAEVGSSVSGFSCQSSLTMHHRSLDICLGNHSGFSQSNQNHFLKHFQYIFF